MDESLFTEMRRETFPAPALSRTRFGWTKDLAAIFPSGLKIKAWSQVVPAYQGSQYAGSCGDCSPLFSMAACARMIDPGMNHAESPRTEKQGSHLIVFQHVSKEYRDDGEPVRALDDVSLEIEPGKFIAIVGRSGCGKSTLLNLAGAMDVPTSGSVLLDGIATNQLNEAQLTRIRREKIGFIFQSFQLLHTLSAVENVELPMLLAGHSNPRSQATESLEWVGLAQLAHRMPHQLSGGQMQRVGIARALIHSPRILLADEPTGNLDTATGNSILDLLQRIRADRKMTILMATVIRMRDGHVEEIVNC
jgi:putative ABC transport system ATP-binding protein